MDHKIVQELCPEMIEQTVCLCDNEYEIIVIENDDTEKLSDTAAMVDYWAEGVFLPIIASVGAAGFFLLINIILVSQY